MSIWKGKHGPLLIAEIGGNHEGDFDYALKLSYLAFEAGVDYVKYQMYSGDTLVSRLESPQRNTHFKKFELSRDQYIHLAELCQQNGAKFLASVWDPKYFDWIDPYMDFYKIGSGDLTAYPVLKATAQLKKPILLSTGLSTEKEVLDAVAYLQSCDARYKDPEYLALLQCTAMYPIPASDAHLSVMNRLSALTGLKAGYSDHTEGSVALETAVACGAEILEFHFTDDRKNKTFRDHKVSLTRDEVLALTDKIKEIKELRGSDQKSPLPVEGDHVVTFRRAIYPSKDLKKGDVLTEDNLICLRPNHGIDAREFDQVIGRKLKLDVQAHQKLSWDIIED